MLHVWLRTQQSPLAVWQQGTKQWHPVDDWQQLHDIYASKNNQHKTLCLYFPSSHILQVDTDLNASQLKQLGNTGKQYLFEEMSLAPVEQLSIRQMSQGESHYLYALAQADIDSWQQSASLVDLHIAALLPDFLLLPIPEEGAGQQVTLYQDDYTLLLRQSMRQGIAVSYLPLMLERLTQLSEVKVLRPIAASDITLLPDQSLQLNTSTDIERDNSAGESELSVDSSLSLHSDTINPHTVAIIAEHQLVLTVLTTTPSPIEQPERHALNFFVKSTDSQLSPYLRVAMIVAFSALVLQIVTDATQSYQYNKAAESTKTAVAAQYQSWFPDERLNPRTQLKTQMDPKLRSDSQSSSHMALLARISPIIKQSTVQAQSLLMQPSSLSFTLTAPNRDSLDKLTSTLVTQGVTAKLDRVNSNDNGQFTGQMTIDISEDNDPAESSTSQTQTKS